MRILLMFMGFYLVLILTISPVRCTTTADPVSNADELATTTAATTVRTDASSTLRNQSTTAISKTSISTTGPAEIISSSTLEITTISRQPQQLTTKSSEIASTLEITTPTAEIDEDSAAAATGSTRLTPSVQDTTSDSVLSAVTSIAVTSENDSIAEESHTSTHSHETTTQPGNTSSTTTASTLSPGTSTTPGPSKPNVTTSKYTEYRGGPVLKSIGPLFGPYVGGTQIRLIANPGMRVPDYFVLEGGYKLEILEKTLTTMLLVTPAMDESDIDRRLQLDAYRDGNAYRTPFYFIFKRNPTVISVSPLKIIRQGGLTLTVNGTSLTSVAVPRIKLMVVNSSPQNAHQEDFYSDCTVANSSIMFCVTPRIQSICDYSTTLNDTNSTVPITDCLEMEKNNITVKMGIIFDGFLEYESLSDISALKKYGELTIMDSPRFAPKYQRLIKGSGRLVLEAYNLDTCCLLSEIKVRVGIGYCTRPIVTNETLTCIAPLLPPIKQTGQTKDSPYAVVVHVGSQLRYHIASLEYLESFPVWIITICVIGGFIIIVDIIAAIIAKRHNNKIKGRKCCPLDACACFTKIEKVEVIQLVEIKAEAPKVDISDFQLPTSINDIEAAIMELERRRAAMLEPAASVESPDDIAEVNENSNDDGLDNLGYIKDDESGKDSDSMVTMLEQTGGTIVVDKADVHVDKNATEVKQVLEVSWAKDVAPHGETEND